MGVTAGIFLVSILLNEMRYLVYIIYLCVQQERVRRNVGKIFLNLIDKHFPHSCTLHKIFNRNSVIVNYSFMDNCKSIISKHNTRIPSRPKSTTQTTSSRNSATISIHVIIATNILSKRNVYWTA